MTNFKEILEKDYNEKLNEESVYPTISFYCDNKQSNIQFSTLLRKEKEGVWYYYAFKMIFEDTGKGDLYYHVQEFHSQCYNQLICVEVDPDLMIHESILPRFIKSEDQRSEKDRLIEIQDRSTGFT